MITSALFTYKIFSSLFAAVNRPHLKYDVAIKLNEIETYIPKQLSPLL